MTYEVTQGDSTYDVEPLSNDEKTAEEFYNYGSPANASANTPRDLEREDTTQLFLYDGPDGVSLFVIHDEPNTDSGGDVTLSFTGLPQTGEWVVTDDSGDSYSHQRASWRWWSCCTDGGVFRGGLTGGFEITIDPSFNSGIDSWILRSEDRSQPIQLDLNEPITISEKSRVSASMRTLQFIPGKSENPSEDGHPLNSGLMQIFPENDSFSVYNFDAELPTEPVFDNWLGGDMIDGLPHDLEDARKTEEGKYRYDVGPGAEFKKYRFENGITVSFGTINDRTIDENTVEIEFSEVGPSGDDSIISRGEQENSKTVLHDHEINGIPWEDWYDGKNVRKSNRQKRYYRYDIDFEFDGVEGVRVLTFWGGYAGFMGDISERVANDAPEFLRTVWDWGDIESSIAELALTAAPEEVHYFLEAATTVPNTYSFLDFVVLADGRRYARVWDASQYPSLFTYIDGRLKSPEKMDYDPQEWYNWDMFVFQALASAGATPYQSMGDRTWEDLVRGSERATEVVEENIERMLDMVPPEWDPSEMIPTVPRVTVGFRTEGGDEPIDNPSEPFPSAEELVFPWGDSLPSN